MLWPYKLVKFLIQNNNQLINLSIKSLMFVALAAAIDTTMIKPNKVK